MPELAARLARAPLPATTTMMVRARQLVADGRDVLALTIGEPDFPSPPAAVAAAHAAALAGRTKYPPQDGLPVLKRAVQRKFARENGLDFALDQIGVANGGKQAIFNAFMATLNEGDEVVIPSPYWTSYLPVLGLAGGVPVFVPCPQNHGFKPRPEDIDAAIGPRTRWLLLNFPNNPTGAALTPDELAAIADVMRRHPHVWIMADDIYEHLRFDGLPVQTLARIAPDLADRVLTIGAVSKTYAMTGWRVGFYAGPRALVAAMVNVQIQATSGVNGPSQEAAAAALEGDQSSVAAQRDAYQRRRDLVVDGLNACRGIVCHRPEGAFYVFPSVAGCIGRVSPGGRVLATDEDVCLAWLEEALVGTVHGAAFGMSPHIRISTATDETTLAEACRRIQAFCEAL